MRKGLFAGGKFSIVVCMIVSFMGSDIRVLAFDIQKANKKDREIMIVVLCSRLFVSNVRKSIIRSIILMEWERCITFPPCWRLKN